VSPVTVAVNVWVAPPISVALPGPTLTEIGVSDTVALAALAGSVLLVTVIVAVAAVTGTGAVYMPPVVIDPTDVLHVTPALAESFVTAAAKACVPPAVRVTDSGLTETLRIGEVL
jgi:hypothetical protein